MIPGVSSLAALHYLGLLVIDEIQNLFNRRTRTSAELLDFIVRIVNDFGVPVLMVGTSEAGEFLAKDFRVTRRITRLLQPNWGRLIEHEREWTIFTDTLWTYQYVRTYSELTAELRHQLFALTQGIPDLVVKLFVLTQRYAINERVEKISSDLLEKVTDTSLVQNKRYLEDLRNGRTPKEDFIYESVFSQKNSVLGLNPQPQTPVQGKAPTTNTPNESRSPGSSRLAAVLAQVAAGESTYEAARKSDLVHTSAAPL
jgi:hypothetical protein